MQVGVFVCQTKSLCVRCIPGFVANHKNLQPLRTLHFSRVATQTNEHREASSSSCTPADSALRCCSRCQALGRRALILVYRSLLFGTCVRLDNPTFRRSRVWFSCCGSFVFSLASCLYRFHPHRRRSLRPVSPRWNYASQCCPMDIPRTLSGCWRRH